MPELPDIETYIGALRSLILDRRLEGVRLTSPFLVRSVVPSLSSTAGRRLLELVRLGKRIVMGLEGDLFLVIHLMIAGRLRWQEPGAKIPGRVGLAALDFNNGSLILTEAGSKKRASLYVVSGRQALAEHDPGGLEVLDAGLTAFGSALRSSGHTLKRALTDPRILSGIGNAYSDEILHRAQLSPFKLTTEISDEESERLFISIRSVLEEWTARLAAEAGEDFPDKVTAFRPEMAVHGRYSQPCPVCEAPVQRIVYANNEANYCPGCQTGGRILADRMLSQLLKDDWPKRLEDLEPKP